MVCTQTESEREKGEEEIGFEVNGIKAVSRRRGRKGGLKEEEKQRVLVRPIVLLPSFPFPPPCGVRPSQSLFFLGLPSLPSNLITQPYAEIALKEEDEEEEGYSDGRDGEEGRIDQSARSLNGP